MFKSFKDEDQKKHHFLEKELYAQKACFNGIVIILHLFNNKVC